MHNSGKSPSVVKTELDLVFDATFGLEAQPGLATAVNSSVFKQETTDRAAVIVEQFMGPGYFEERAEMQDVSSSPVKVGNQKTFAVLNYSNSVDISKNLFDDDQHTTVDKMIRSMARNARLTRDMNAMKQFNLGFTTVLTNDGVALFSDSHVTLDGTTVDNLTTAALSETSLDLAIQALMTQKTQDGTLGGHVPAVLLVAPAKFKLANEICKSSLRSGTGDNDMNYYSDIYPGLQVLQSPFLSAGQGGSDTAWFLLSADHSMIRWVREGIQTSMVNWDIQRNNNYIYKAEYREVVGPISFEGLYGSTGLV